MRTEILIIFAALVAACSDPNQLSRREISSCRDRLEVSFSRVLKDEGSAPEVLKRIADEADARNLSPTQIAILSERARSIPDDIEAARRHRDYINGQLDAAAEGPIEGIREKYKTPLWCSGGTALFPPARSVVHGLENPETLRYEVQRREDARERERIREAHQEEVRRNAAEMERINGIKSQLRRQAFRVYSTTDGYGAIVQLFHMPDGNTLECKTDFTGGSPLFWCEGGYGKYVR